MTKPWEQEWRQYELDARYVETADGWAVAEASPASERGGFTEIAEVARLISAAPDMARALVAFIERAKDSDLRFTAYGELLGATDALRKAGVIP